jgi:hypothetical protein
VSGRQQQQQQQQQQQLSASAQCRRVLCELRALCVKAFAVALSLLLLFLLSFPQGICFTSHTTAAFRISSCIYSTSSSWPLCKASPSFSRFQVPHMLS